MNAPTGYDAWLVVAAGDWWETLTRAELYEYLGDTGWKRHSVMHERSAVMHEFERKCSECPRLSLLYVDPKDTNPETIKGHYDSAEAIVTDCGHDVP
jgi:hypothetical protein